MDRFSSVLVKPSRTQGPVAYSDHTWRKTHHSVRLLLLSPAKEVWGKVMCLHLSVILFTGGGWLPSMHHRSHNQLPGGLPLGGGSASRGGLPLGVYLQGGMCILPLGGLPNRGQGLHPGGLRHWEVYHHPLAAEPPPSPHRNARKARVVRILLESTSCGWYAFLFVFFKILLCRQFCVLRLLQSFIIWHSEQYNSIKNGLISEVVLASKLSLILWTGQFMQYDTYHGA